jgi:endonuclease YncB( thermonuclease family)
MSQRFLFVAGLGLVLALSEIGANHAGQQQNQSHPNNSAHVTSNSAHVTSGHAAGGFSGGAAHTNVSRATAKTVVNSSGQHVSVMAVHRADPVLKSAAQATSSKVQQQLSANGQLHHWHHHNWRWGEYGYLPTNASSMVVGVPTGNTLTITNNAGLGYGNGYGTVFVQSRAQRAAQRNGLSVAGIPVVGPVLNQGVVTVRLAGVASPMVGQPFAAQSQQHLASVAMGRHVRVFQTGVDPTGAIVGQVFLAGSGTNLNERQLRDGMAFNSVNDGFSPALAAAEEAALMAHAGLWNGKRPIAPWLMTP